VRVTTVTKTLARGIARASLTGGYFAEGDQGLRGRKPCPCCERVIYADLPREHWGKPDGRKRQALVRAIEAALVDHLTDFYDDSACPHTRCRPRHDVGHPVEP
jgi:hypothetical protein